MADPTYPLIPVLAFIAFLATIAPTGFITFRDQPGIAIFIFWQSTNCIQLMVNRILWHDHANDVAPLWCDISTKIEMARLIGIPASQLCMMRGIYLVMQLENHFDANAKRRVVLQSLLIGVLFPVVCTSFWPLMAGNRYGIIEDTGCLSTVFCHWVTLLVFQAWPPVFTIVTSSYCVLILRKFATMTNRNVFTGLSNSNRHLFSRTLACAKMVPLTLLPATIYSLSYTMRFGVGPYPGAAQMAKYRQDTPIRLLDKTADGYWWHKTRLCYYYPFMRILTSFCFFSIFGTGKVAVRYYSRIYHHIADRLGIRKAVQTQQGILEDDMEFAVAPAETTVDSKGRDTSLIEGIASGEAEGPSSLPNV